MDPNAMRGAHQFAGPNRGRGGKQVPSQPNYGYNPNPGGYGQSPQIFEDTSIPPYASQPQSYSHMPPQGNVMGDWSSQGYGQPFPGQQVLSDPMAAMAVQYGQTLAGQGKEFVNEKLEKYVSVSKLKYYFAVDTAYVAKKLGLLFFPFTHSDWTVHYNQDEPIQPRYDVNAPDLYIPSMAFVTYVLTAGYILGMQNRFTPEQLGMQASSVLVWLICEILIIMLCLYIFNISSTLKIFDWFAFCSYKFVCMIVALLASILFKTIGYIAVLLYSSLSLGYFLLKTLHVSILAHSSSGHYAGSSRMSTYVLLGICIVQPIMMYWLTYHLVNTYVPS
ncbi:protein YIF1B-B [Centruroides vittatus]|uniref:protein YIF1B-B n=1 Tax=Centruroides vittatus TaxID=120091 RepID=UPI00350F6137